MFKNFKLHRIVEKRAGKRQTKENPPLMEGEVLSKSDLEVRIAQKRTAAKTQAGQTGEQGGPEGPEPTRYGDWEVGGKVSDF